MDDSDNLHENCDTETQPHMEDTNIGVTRAQLEGFLKNKADDPGYVFPEFIHEFTKCHLKCFDDYQRYCHHGVAYFYLEQKKTTKGFPHKIGEGETWRHIPNKDLSEVVNPPGYISKKKKGVPSAESSCSVRGLGPGYISIKKKFIRRNRSDCTTLEGRMEEYTLKSCVNDRVVKSIWKVLPPNWPINGNKKEKAYDVVSSPPSCSGGGLASPIMHDADLELLQMNLQERANFEAEAKSQRDIIFKLKFLPVTEKENH